MKTAIIIIGILTVVFWVLVAVDLVMRKFAKSIPGVAQIKAFLVKVLSYTPAPKSVPPAVA
jgi:hypothetical protein